MMLRASIDHSGAVADVSGIDGSSGSGLVHGAELVAFAEAAVGGDPATLALARVALADAAGSEAMVDAAAVVANFEMMTRLADTTGAAVDEGARASSAEARSLLGIDRFDTARWG
jgi:hypothetical protein